ESAGGEYTFFDRLVLGLGLAYSHSGVDWQEHHSTASLNSLYFGPRLSYVFSHGYLSGTLFGVANFYQIDREINLFPTKMKPGSTTTAYQSWDVVARLEGGLAYEAGSHFFLYPTARVDYLYVLQPETSEKLDDEIEMKIEAFNETFLCSKAGLKVTREFFGETIGYLIPSVSAGWIYFTPQSNKSYQYEMEGCSKFEKEVKSGSWNQYYLGAGFALVHKKGILVSLDYELTLGADSPLQAGNIRVEWSW
ncbi:MAG TPA: autotransporter outer membrane beta-barrel domain-containing protein, partial [Rhabdochlamydiaceae bacterium]|nr:autotransporter outer membrane beta-barrel domain-containing protein [Rhabdochlamydiaceae bacterium]